MDINKLDDELILIIDKIDKKREEIEEKAKNTSQYKSSKKYKQVDQRYLDFLLTKRNTLVGVVNYIRTNEKTELNKIYKEE